jgi:ligand-binding SRPBCC domain-containing protein
VSRRHVLYREQRIERPLQEVFEFFSNAANLEAITPRFLRFHIRTPQPIALQAGARIEYALSLFGVPVYWRTLISVWEPPVRFVDEQASGPFTHWRHEHTFEERDGGVLMRDRVEYEEPLGLLGLVAHHLFVERLLRRVFDYRAEQVDRLIATRSAER